MSTIQQLSTKERSAAAESPTDSLPVAASRKRLNLVDSVLLLLVVANAAALLSYLFYTYQFYFHSDSAAANLLAQEIYETRQYFPADWNWANGDIWSLFMHTWILVLLPFFDNGFTLHAAGATIGCVITGTTTWGVCTILGMSKRTKLFTLALLFAGVTPVMSEHMFGQQAYGTTYYIACAMLITGWKCIHAKGKQALPWCAATAALVVIVAWANPQRALIYYVLPLAAAIAALYGASRAAGTGDPVRNRNMLGLLIVAAAATFIGMLLYQGTLAASMSLRSKIAVNWLAFPAMTDNIVRVVHGLAGLLGGTPQPGTPIATPLGVQEALRFVGALAVIAIAPFALARCVRGRHPGHVFVAAAAGASISTSLFIYLTTTLAIDGSPELSVRYLVPGVMMVLLVVIAYVAHCTGAGLAKRAIAAAGLGVMALSAPWAYELVKMPQHLANGGAKQNNPNLRLVRFLEAEGLHYGYATFWNAGQLTILSNSKSKVRQIQFDDSMPVPMRHLSSNRWYEPDAWRDPTFLLLARSEVEKVNLDRVFEATGAPVRRIDFEGVHIIVFDHNIAADFPAWRSRVTEPVIYRVTLRTPHAVGRFDEATHSIIGEKGEAGALRFGPYQRLAPGRYLVSFNLRVDSDAQADFGKVDVVAASGSKTLASSSIQATGAQRITLAVAFDEVADAVEFRVFSSGAGKISVFNVELANDDRTK